MNRIWVVVLMFVLPLIFTLKVSGQVVSSETMKTEVLKEPRFNASLGLGNAYNFAGEGLNMSFGNSKTTSLKAGYSLSRYLDVLIERASFSEFFCLRKNTAIRRQEISMGFGVTSLNLKAGVPIKVKKVAIRPYFTLGIIGKNKLRVENNAWDIVNGEKTNPYNKSGTGSGKTSKTGFGLDVMLSPNVFLFYELNRWKLYSNLDDGYVFKTTQSLLGLGVKF